MTRPLIAASHHPLTEISKYMLNLNGVLAVLDHHLAINWDDGPTLLKMGAQVRYHTSESATSKVLRVNASQRYSDEPLSFGSANADIRAMWVWQERANGWTAQLSVKNESGGGVDGDDGDDLYLDALEIIRIDSGFGGVFSLGAPTGLWQCSVENLLLGSGDGSQVSGTFQWDSWSLNTSTASGFTRSKEMVIQPSASNRSHPPALLFRVLGGADGPATELNLELTGEKFERFTARLRCEGMLI
ncbi:MAG: hypothetical protein HC853_07640, partial [Anaerolineae bacterium]|nr:hypothetical protein [Anaerolineae bacterium]